MSSTNPTLINGFEDVMVHIRKLEEENKKLQEEVNYWKNFALVYWSGNQLGNLRLAESCDNDVWVEALEECDSNDDYDRETLTKKCLQKN